MKLKEFIKPDYSNMSEEELSKHLEESILRMGKIIDESNKRIENESKSRFPNTRFIQKISQTP